MRMLLGAHHMASDATQPQLPTNHELQAFLKFQGPLCHPLAC